MSDLTLTLQRNPFADLERFFARLNRPGSADVRKVSTALGQGWQQNFSSESSGDGTPWAALRPFTVAERIAAGYPGAHPILRRSGRLRDSLVNPGHPEHYERVAFDPSGWTMESGTDVDYALELEIGRERMPARPFIQLSADAEQRVLSALEYLVDQAQQQTVGR